MQAETVSSNYTANIICDDQIEVAANALKAGRLVAFPTDTVFGVGADPFNEAAIEALFAAKRRPLDKGIPILLSDASHLARVISAEISPTVRNIIERYWPGPVTLILPRVATLPYNIAPGASIAVRVPDHPVARALIEAAGGAVATSSANRSGMPETLTAHSAAEALDDTLACVLDGQPVPAGTASTVLDCTTQQPQILRRGPVGWRDIVELII